MRSWAHLLSRKRQRGTWSVSLINVEGGDSRSIKKRWTDVLSGVTLSSSRCCFCRVDRLSFSARLLWYVNRSLVAFLLDNLHGQLSSGREKEREREYIDMPSSSKTDRRVPTQSLSCDVLSCLWTILFRLTRVGHPPVRRDSFAYRQVKRERERKKKGHCVSG